MAKKKSYAAIKKACKEEMKAQKAQKAQKASPKAHLTEHKTKKIVIKHGDVDVKIIPLVKWMNSFESVHTLFSCEGGTLEDIENKEKYSNKPYVLFTCWCQLDMMMILRETRHVSVCEVTWYESYPIRYHLKFPDKETLLEFCKRDRIKKFA